MTDNETRVRKILFNEISFCIAGIALISSVIFWISNPQNENKIEIVKLQSQIENNETVTIALTEMKANDLHEINIKLLQLETRQIELLKAISRIEALIN